jgi:outer membrane protein assembly factor BamD
MSIRAATRPGRLPEPRRRCGTGTGIPCSAQLHLAFTRVLAIDPAMLDRSPLKLAVLAVAMTGLLLTAGCAGRGGKNRDTAYVARDVDTLYAAAKDRLDRGDARQAAALFDEVERQHPYSPWARRAQLMSAFSYYAARDYTKATQSAQRFLSIHPGNRDAPYAYYLIALCYYEQISDVTRDQKITQQAKQALTDVVRRYPNTRYAGDARLKLDLVNDHLAGKEMTIGRLYERTGRWVAATLRFRNVVENYETTSHAPEALFRLVESYLSLGIPEEAQKAAAVLGSNYPDSEWYHKAYDLMSKHAAGTTAI